MKLVRKYPHSAAHLWNPAAIEILWGVFFIVLSTLLVLLLLLAALRSLHSRPDNLDTPKVSTYTETSVSIPI
jgi:hypothetical protein